MEFAALHTGHDCQKSRNQYYDQYLVCGAGFASTPPHCIEQKSGTMLTRTTPSFKSKQTRLVGDDCAASAEALQYCLACVWRSRVAAVLRGAGLGSDETYCCVAGRAQTTVAVPAPESGVITEYLVEEGDTVALNAPLFTIDTSAGRCSSPTPCILPRPAPAFAPHPTPLFRRPLTQHVHHAPTCCLKYQPRVPNYWVAS